jgi:MFS transporter, NNP family, nitrate/nitrite transporter
VLGTAIGLMLLFALFQKMANGAVFGIVPFINEKRTGLIAGVVGAGGNLGGMVFGFLFRSESLRYAEVFGAIGMTVVGVAVFVSCIRWAPPGRPNHNHVIR